MLALEILGLVLASLGALYGIWTQPERNNTVAIVSTIITASGVVFAAALAVWKSKQAEKDAAIAEKKRQAGIQAVLASTKLSDLEITWRFDGVPEDVLRVLTLGEMIADTELLQNDERSRLPTEVQQKAMQAWRLRSTVNPLLHVIDSGATGTKGLYKGELLTEAIRRWESDRDEWVSNIGSNISYIGPAPELIFPLNAKLNAALSLGKARDDQVEDQARFIWQEDDPSLFAETNFGFEVKVERRDTGFSMTWTYDQSSLDRAVERASNTRLVAGLPTEFSFVLVRKQLQREEYLTKVAEHFKEFDLPPRKTGSSRWDSRSVLEVYLNGLKEPHYTYVVTKAGTRSLSTNAGAYDEPLFEYDYTRFDCTLSGI